MDKQSEAFIFFFLRDDGAFHCLFVEKEGYQTVLSASNNLQRMRTRNPSFGNALLVILRMKSAVTEHLKIFTGPKSPSSEEEIGC